MRKQYMQELKTDWERSVEIRKAKQREQEQARVSATAYQRFEGEDLHAKERNRAKAEQVGINCSDCAPQVPFTC
jgi:hypothetical protein